jgi:hypothetical protein
MRAYLLPLLLAGCSAPANAPTIDCSHPPGGEAYCNGWVLDAGPGAPCAVNGVLGHIAYNDDGSEYCQQN